MRVAVSSFAFAAAVVAGASSANSEGPAALTPEAIYLRATHAMKDAAEPPYVTFREDVTARNMRLSCTADGTNLSLKHGDIAGSYRVWYRTRDENAISQEVGSQKRCKGALLYPTGSDLATLGAPSAAPSATPVPDAGDGPPIIAAVRVESARFYKITLVDRESFEGHPVYRLALKAYRDPTTHPLTGMLVDEESFLVRQASGEAAGHYVVASGRVAGVVTFDRSGEYWVARDETFDLAAQALFVHAHCNVIVRASDFQYPADIDNVFPSPSPSPGAHR
ncbi:MAG: hypothetical protein IAI50_04765 [Candidatus Eremiobacteraeota bacterium]|nr:hypothetical protein [Candidatus Eremiobacteraeota bacterium]